MNPSIRNLILIEGTGTFPVSIRMERKYALLILDVVLSSAYQKQDGLLHCGPIMENIPLWLCMFYNLLYKAQSTLFFKTRILFLIATLNPLRMKCEI